MFDRTRTYDVLRLLLLCGALVALNTGCDRDKMSDADHVQRAKDFQESGDLRSALIELKNAAQKNPENRDARWLLGQIYLKFEHGAAAEKELRRALQLGVEREAVVVPLGTALLLQGKLQELLTNVVTDNSFDQSTNAQIEVLRSKAHIGGGKIDHAQAAVDQAVALAPELVVVKVAQARMQALRGELDAAKQQVEQALKEYPESAEAWSFLADIERWQGSYAEAEAAYTKAIDSSQYTDTSDRYNRIMMRIAMKDYEGAQRDIEVLKGFGRNWAGLHYVQGLLDYYNERYAEAQIDFEKAVNLDAKHTASIFFLGATHYVQRHWQQADRYLAQALSAAPGLTDARLLLAGVRLQTQAYGEARTILQPVIEARPDDPVLLRLLHNIAMRSGETGQAVNYARRLVSLQPNAGDAHFQLAQALLASGDNEQGTAELRRALELAPDLAPAEALLALNDLKAGNADKALRTAQRLREEQPDSALPLNLIGAAKTQLGDSEGATAAFEQALRLSPGDVETANNLARLALSEGDTQRTEAVYQDILGKNPGHLFTLLSLAEFEARRGRTEQANELLRQAIEKHPEALRPRLLLARFHLRTGAPIKAVELLQAVQAQHGSDPTLLKTLGEAQLALGQGTLAVETFRQLVQVWPDSVIPRYLLANARGATGDWEGMRRGLEQVLQAQPDYKDAQIAMVRLEALQQNLDQARTALSRLKKEHPDDADVLGVEGWLLSLLKNFAESAAVYEQAMAKTPRSDWMVSMARAYWLSGDSEKAIARLQEWIAAHPNDLDTRYALASMLAAKKRPAEAVKAYKDILEQDGEQVVALNNLAFLLREQDVGSALGYAEKAYRLQPDLVEVQDTYATLLMDQGRTEQALRILRTAVQSPNATPAVHLHLAQAYVKAGNHTAARSVLETLVAQESAFAEREQAVRLLDGLQGS